MTFTNSGVGRTHGLWAKTRSPLRFLVLLALLLVPGAPEILAGQSGAGDTGSLNARIDAVLSRPPMDGVHWGVLLVDAERGEVLYGRNAHLRFVPASNMKLPVAATALDRLGPSWRYRTGFWVEPGALLEEGGRLAGDLTLVAHGDPSLGEPFHTSGEGALGALADSLLATGLREVDGDLVVDLAAWDSTTVPSGWLVGNLNARYAATGGAFSIENGELELHPRALIRILDDARSRPWALAFHDAMAEPGKPRTTLSNRLTDLEGRVHAKTGTISHVNSLSGYLVSNDGRPLLFAVMSNAANLPAGQIRRTIDDVVREMVRR